MSRTQKRRSVSLQRVYYDALKQLSEQRGTPLVSIVETAVYPILCDAGLLDESAKKIDDGKYWDPRVKRWRSPATRGPLDR